MLLVSLIHIVSSKLYASNCFQKSQLMWLIKSLEAMIGLVWAWKWWSFLTRLWDSQVVQLPDLGFLVIFSSTYLPRCRAKRVYHLHSVCIQHRQWRIAPISHCIYGALLLLLLLNDTCKYCNHTSKPHVGIFFAILYNWWPERKFGWGEAVGRLWWRVECEGYWSSHHKGRRPICVW